MKKTGERKMKKEAEKEAEKAKQKTTEKVSGVVHAWAQAPYERVKKREQ